MIPHANLLKTHMEAVRVHRERADRLRQRFRGSVGCSGAGECSVQTGHKTDRRGDFYGSMLVGQVARPDTAQPPAPAASRESPSESKLKSLLRPCLSDSGKRKQRHDRRVSIDPVPRTHLLPPMPAESQTLFYNELDFQRFEEEDEFESGSPKRMRVMPKPQDAHAAAACDAAASNLRTNTAHERHALGEMQAAGGRFEVCNGGRFEICNRGRFEVCNGKLQPLQRSCELPVKNRSSHQWRIGSKCDENTASSHDNGCASSPSAAVRQCAQPQLGGTAGDGRQLRPHQLRALKEVQQMDVDELKQKIREVASRRRERLERIGSRGTRG